MEQYDVEYYELASQRCPFSDYLDGLSEKAQAAILYEVQMLADYGPELRAPHSKPVGKGLFEIRAKSGDGALRAFYFFLKGNRIVITNGYVKKTQKMDKIEYKLALGYKADYMDRNSK